MATDWDAVIVGGGHNGLVAACYMAKAGLKVAVLERREVVGGASVTEETFPGFRISTAAMVGGLLKPKIAADLELHKFGYGPLVPYDPVALQLYPDNRYMLWWSDPVKTLDEFAKFSRKDGEAFLDLRKRMDRLAAVLKPLELRPPMSVEEIARRFPDPEDAYFFQEVLVSPMKDFLDARFETEEAKASICSNGLGRSGGRALLPGQCLHDAPLLARAWHPDWRRARRHGRDNCGPGPLCPQPRRRGAHGSRGGPSNRP